MTPPPGSLSPGDALDALNVPGPTICSEFEHEGVVYQTIWWRPEGDEPGRWDVVRADLPYIWRANQAFSETFDG